MWHRELTTGEARGISFLAALAIGMCVTGCYCVVAGKPPSHGAFIIPLSAVLYLPTGLSLLGRGMAAQKTLEPPEFLKEAMNAAGLFSIKLFVHSSSRYAGAIAYGPLTTISETTISEWSREAVAWSVVTESYASWQSYKVGMPILMGSASFTVIALALGERLKWGTPYVVMVLLAFIAAFTAIPLLGYRLQLVSDKLHTSTPSQRDAAKEALSHLLFDQLDRRWIDRWPFLCAEIKGRSRQLGVTLERGYRVPVPEVDP